MNLTRSDYREYELYDFGLSHDQEARAERLHTDCVVWDMLSQMGGGNIFEYYPDELLKDLRERQNRASNADELWTETLYWPFEMSLQGRSNLILEWFKVAGLSCGTFSDIRVHDGNDPGILERERRVLTYAQLPWLCLVTSADQIRQAKHDGKIAFYANCQPVVAAPRDLGAFDRAYAKGLRSIMLTYNRMDHIGAGCTERVDGGLSMFGVDVVRHCNETGMMVDVSHCGRHTTKDACDFSKAPVNANHTGAHAVFPHARCKTDEEIKAIAATGGVIGIVTVPFFLSRNSKPTVEHMLDHIDHVVNLVGWEHVAIGSDWPLQAPDPILQATLGTELQDAGFREEDRVEVTERLVGFDDARQLRNITRGLVSRGYADLEIEGILGGNGLRVFEAVCG